MQSFNFELKTKMFFGIGESLNLGDHLKKLGYKTPVIVVDKNIFYSSYVDRIFDSLEDFDVKTILYEFPGEPTYEYLDTVFNNYKKTFGNLDVIVGIGGGSVIDFAKGLAVLSTNLGPALSYRGFPEKLNKPIPVVAIPTTAGTGSEVTYNAVFIESKEKKKLGINTKLNYPVLAILDPNLIVTCPKKVLLSSALDALVHSVECFNSPNELTRWFARRAVRYLFDSIPEISNWDTLETDKKLNISSKLQIGAYLAGASIINGGGGPSSAMSYPLGTQFNVPHGFAGGIFLPHIIQFNQEHNIRYPDPLDEEYNFKYFFDRIDFNFNDLTQFGVTEFNVHLLLDKLGGLKGAFDLNPVKFTTEDATNIIRSMI
jgi:alcohol dehydrogenase